MSVTQIVAISILCFTRTIAFDWTYEVKFGTDIELPCNDSLFTPSEGNPLIWYKESGQGEVVVLAHGPKYGLLKRHNVTDMILLVRDVTAEDFGIYRCEYTNSSSEVIRVRKGLNMAGALYDSLLDKYRYQFGVAGIASGTALGMFLFTCLVYKFRYREPRSYTFESRSKLHDSTTGIDNITTAEMTENNPDSNNEKPTEEQTKL